MMLHNLYINPKIINPQWSNSRASQKYFSIEQSPVLLDVYDSLKKLGTVGATSKTETISVIYNLNYTNLGYENIFKLQ